jgi:hypothetical protein
MYNFEGLIFEFKSTSADALNSTNTALGVVIAATNYDVLDPNFSGKRQMEAYEFCTSTKPSCSMIHPVECKKGLNVLENMYVTQVQTPASLPANSDARLYYIGNFQLATEGMQAASNIGEVWVSYQVRLMRPKLPTPVGSAYSYGHWNGNSVSSSLFNTTLVRPDSTLSSSVTPGPTGNKNAISFIEPGRFLISLTAIGGITGFTGAYTIASGNGAFPALISAPATPPINDFYSLTVAPVVTTTSGGGANCWTVTVLFDVFDTSGGATVLQMPTITVSSVTSYDLIISQVSSGLTLAPPSLVQEQAEIVELRNELAEIKDMLKSMRIPRLVRSEDSEIELETLPSSGKNEVPTPHRNGYFYVPKALKLSG